MLPPLWTVAGETATLLSTGILTVIDAVVEAPFAVAVNVGVVFAATGLVLTVKVA